MAHRSIRVVLVSLIAAVLGMVASPAPSEAKLPSGGWALSTLDDTPTVVAGESVDIGFTIRQHGQHPVDADIGEVGIVVRVLPGERSWEYPSGDRFFPARRGDRPGHFVAAVTVPDAGTYAWHVRQGWFGEHDLGELQVERPDPAGAWWEHPARPALLGLAAVFGVVAIVDPRRFARGRTTEPDAAALR